MRLWPRARSSWPAASGSSYAHDRASHCWPVPAARARGEGVSAASVVAKSGSALERMAAPAQGWRAGRLASGRLAGEGDDERKQVVREGPAARPPFSRQWPRAEALLDLVIG